MFTKNVLIDPAVCPAGQSEPLGRTLSAGERLLYKTQAGRLYTNNVNCTVNFKLGPTCARMKIFCKRVNLQPGDQLTLSHGGKTKRWGDNIATVREV